MYFADSVRNIRIVTDTASELAALNTSQMVLLAILSAKYEPSHTLQISQTLSVLVTILKGSQLSSAEILNSRNPRELESVFARI